MAVQRDTWIFRVILLVGWACSIPAFAVTEKELANYSMTIFSNPQHAHHELTQFHSGPTQLSEHEHIWTLLRKAQAEYTLLSFQEMKTTLSVVQPFSESMSTEQRAVYFYLIGILDYNDGLYNQAITQFERAINLTHIGSTPSLTYVLIIRELGYVHALSGNYHEAIVVLQEAYNKAVPSNNILYNGLISESLADTYNYLGNYPKAIEYYEQALGFFDALDYPSYIASSLLGLAIVNRKLERWDEAIHTFDRYEVALNFTENASENFYLHYGKAMTLAEKGDCDVAISAIDKALLLDGPIDYKAELYKKRALCQISTNHIQQAQQDLVAAKDILDSIDDLNGTQWYLELDYLAGLIAAKERDFERAFNQIHHYFKDYVALQQRNNSEHMARVQATLEAERKDKEIAQLKQQAQLQQLQAREQALKVTQHRMQLFGIAVVLTLLIIFAVFQYKNSQKLLTLSIRDELTGLHNRRYFFDFFENHKESALASANSGMAVVSFDIDNFKTINDSWGHQTGDYVISTIAHIAADSLRPNDIIARIGGDEFVIALLRTTRAQTETIAQRLLANISHHEFCLQEGESFNTTVSVGVAFYSPTQHSRCDIHALIESADNALYQSKRAGKNRFTVSSH